MLGTRERLTWTHDRASGGEPNVVDYLIQARDGGHTTLRLVNSGFGDGANFDDELESTSHAWPLFLLLLKHKCEHPHAHCENQTLYRVFDLPREHVWRQLTTGPNIDGQLRHWDPFGNACYELNGTNRSLIAIFCETCGPSTGLTIMCLLYDATAAAKESARQAAESLVAKVLKA